MLGCYCQRQQTSPHGALVVGSFQPLQRTPQRLLSRGKALIYGDGFSNVEHHFLDVLSLAKGNENVKGIVVNAFTQQFIVEKDLFEFIANLPTNVEE